jgi:hypothetical protein
MTQESNMKYLTTILLVKGQTIDGAMLALKEVVKSHVSHALEHLWSLLP